jgi:hypothetical protein
MKRQKLSGFGTSTGMNELKPFGSISTPNKRKRVYTGSKALWNFLVQKKKLENEHFPKVKMTFP